MDLRISWKKHSTTNWITTGFLWRSSLLFFPKSICLEAGSPQIWWSLSSISLFFNGQNWNGSIPISSIHFAGKSQLDNSEFSLKIGSFANKNARIPHQTHPKTRGKNGKNHRRRCGEAVPCPCSPCRWMVVLRRQRRSSWKFSQVPGRSQRSQCQKKPSEQFNWFNWVWLMNMGLSENSVPLHPMVNDHYPY